MTVNVNGGIRQMAVRDVAFVDIHDTADGYGTGAAGAQLQLVKGQVFDFALVRLKKSGRGGKIFDLVETAVKATAVFRDPGKGLPRNVQIADQLDVDAACPIGGIGSKILQVCNGGDQVGRFCRTVAACPYAVRYLESEGVDGKRLRQNAFAVHAGYREHRAGAALDPDITRGAQVCRAFIGDRKGKILAEHGLQLTGKGKHLVRSAAVNGDLAIFHGRKILLRSFGIADVRIQQIDVRKICRNVCG